MIKNFVAKLLRTPKFKQRKVESKRNTKERRRYPDTTLTTTEKNGYFMTITNEQAAYIAGLFDGEGSIYFAKRPEKKKKHKGDGYRTSISQRISMEVTMTDKSVIKWIHEVLGVGTVVKKPRKGLRKDGTKYLMQWKWRCTFRDAFYVCCILWPHAHTKLPKIQQIIDHYSGKLMNDKIVSLEDYKIKMALE